VSQPAAAPAGTSQPAAAPNAWRNVDLSAAYNAAYAQGLADRLRQQQLLLLLKQHLLLHLMTVICPSH
jgi:hypothetical protein